MDELNFFNSLEYLEPRCPKCNVVLDYGVNTKFDEQKKVHLCSNCGAVLE